MTRMGSGVAFAGAILSCAAKQIVLPPRKRLSTPYLWCQLGWLVVAISWGQEAGPNWVKVTDNAGWRPRDSSGELTFQGKMWLFGGWFDSFAAPPRDVWSSSDGKQWSLVNKEAPWKHSDLPMSVVFQDKMWLLGGWYNGRLPGHSASHEVWSSSDGIQWEQATANAAWSPRIAAGVVEFNGKLWILGGTENYYFGDEKSLKGDVWSSADGKEWKQETAQAPWPPRAYHSAVVHAGRMWVLGGGNYVPQYQALNDVWSSTDGVHWEQATAQAPWTPRLWFSSVVYRDHIWVLGGWSNNPSKNWGDVWFSKDGKDWRQLQSPMTWKERHEHSVYLHDDKIWVAGGHAQPLSNEVWSLTLPPDWNPSRRPDVLIADFETKDYGAWVATGTAFGPGPAVGTLPNQMPVSGFHGERLVNSYFQGDGTTGTLTSPPFRIERRFINFLVGGGNYPSELGIRLLVDGKIVRSESGPNDRPGGSERLDWATWDVADLAGREAVVQIVDARTGGWGHINVDHIQQSDRKLQAEPAEKTFMVQQRYLLLPVKTGETVRRMRLEVGGRTVREWEIELAESQPQFQAFLDLSAFRDQTAKLVVDRLPADSKALDGVRTVDELPAEAGSYREPVRPAFHFTSRVGWLNDPNGLVYQAGEWHLYYQHNPYGWNWGNMHWGHAVSSDLLHWRELPMALYPKEFGDWAFSGSAVVDQHNTSGWQQGDEPPLVAAYTSTGRGECVCYSRDRGRTWTEFDGNPVVKHQGRDPRLLWHAGSKQWVMAVYDEFENKRWIAFYSSPDLKQWTYHSRIEGFFECPDLFELPIDGGGESRWVLYGADGKYVLGSFDGREFRPDSDKHDLWYGNFYAAQTFSDAPGNRRVQIGWGNGITFPGQPFNQQMTIPCELTLRRTSQGLRMFAWPVAELLQLRTGEPDQVREIELQPGKELNRTFSAELFDAEFDFAVGRGQKLTLTLRGVPVTYDGTKQELSCQGRTAPLPVIDGHVRLRVLMDRGSLEIFGNGGATAMSVGAIAATDRRDWSVATQGEGPIRMTNASFHPLQSTLP